jgi:selenide, water dikinase
LAQVLSRLPQPVNQENLIVGFNTADDAGVFRLTPELAIVQTVDFFSPVVDDPYLFGQIAAVNSLSDVWAMGGEPLTAMAIAALPIKTVPWEVLAEIARGGAELLASVGVSLVGGHTVDDELLKFGYSVTGTVHPDKVVTNAGAQPGDCLLLTKPLGVGILTSGIKMQKTRPDAEAAVIQQMLATNQAAGRALPRYQAHAATDITGFGFVGHAYQLARASQVTLEIDPTRLPILPQTLELIGQRVLTRGDRSNREYVGDNMLIAEDVPSDLRSVMFDPQTAGGLLISLAADQVSAMQQELALSGVTATLIGQVTAYNGYHLRIGQSITSR